MIDAQGNLRCDGCNKKLGLDLHGDVKIPCTRCKRLNQFNSKRYESHTLELVKAKVKS